MRDVQFLTSYLIHPAGSCLASYGDTKVICTVSLEDRVPPFLEGKGCGWLTAEYGMLPGSTGGGRKKREIGKRDGRSTEIQRLIGRSLRASVDMEKLGERTLTVDCDVIQADGGTRTASVSGGWVALYEALSALAEREGQGSADYYLKGQLAAVSVGIVDGEVICDLDYAHDSRAEVDMNIVKLEEAFVELQGTGEQGTFSSEQLASLIAAADEGLKFIFQRQRDALKIDSGFTFRQ
ncbi:ribonuclease PH [Sediminispirochaeta bajacaliforniensis]|uniref:ribonuclease PH n=1 Tax=Sediminispirochaeta bajacaliforniensis TaxID=148 RepID=UPI00035C3309|nr:ribonuclease PH [Sediminispirochaeta bajacaliforniensis]